jgi:uncharacterized protein YggU (UPF0235/DUF167 family)
VDGEANHALIRFLSKSLHIPTSDISIVSGHSSRHKIIRITDSFLKEEILNKLKMLIKP